MTTFEIRAKIKILQGEIELKKAEIARLNLELFKVEYKPITWEELKNWLIENRPENIYAKNPRVVNKYKEESYCFINDNGDLQTGPYEHYDKFPRGCEMFVHREYLPWRR